MQVPKPQKKIKFHGPSVIIGSIVINLLGLAFPLFMLQVYDRILPFHSTDTLFLVTSVVAILILFEGILRYFRSIMSSNLAAQFEHTAMVALLRRNLQNPLNLTEGRGIGRNLNDFRSIASLKGYYGGQSFQQFLDVPFIIIYIVVIAFINPFLSFLIVVGYTIFFLFSSFYSKRAESASKDFNELEGRRANFLIEIFKNTHTLKALSMEPSMMRRYERLQEATAKLYAKIAYILDMAGNLGSVFSGILTAAVIAMSAYLVIQGDMTNGELAAAALLTLRSVSPIQRFGGILARRQQDFSKFEELQIDDLLQHSLTDERGKPFEEAYPSGSSRKRVSIEIKGLSYSYAALNEPLLSDVNAFISSGSCVLIDGPSGSGKSTLLQILGGLLLPDQTGITYFNESGSSDEQLNVSPRVSYLSSGNLLLSGSILDNITAFDDARAEEALRIANAIGLTELVSKLPDGWLTQVGDSSVDPLPPGYSQIIGIVRSLSIGPDVILFDEANTNLDIATDQKLLNYLSQLQGTVTTVMVSNRPTYRALANQTVVLPAATKHSDQQQQPFNDVSSSAPMMVSAPWDTEYFPNSELLSTQEASAANWNALNSLLDTKFSTKTDIQYCLPVLLESLKYEGSAREVSQNLPYYVNQLDLHGFNDTLVRLGFSIAENHGALQDIDPRLLPALFVPDDGAAFVVLLDNRGELVIRSGLNNDVLAEEDLNPSGTFYYYDRPESDSLLAGHWTKTIILRFSSALTGVIISSLMIGIMLVAPSVFLILVYGSVIPSGSVVFLTELFIGVLLCGTLAWFAYQHRARILTHVAGRTEYLMSTSILNRVFMMPPGYTERASIGAQYSRIRGFEGIRDSFHSPLGSTLSDVPATIFVAAALILINHIAAYVILGAIVLYLITYKILSPRLSVAVINAGQAANKRNEFLTETFLKVRLIKEIGVADAWLARFRKVCANASATSLKASFISATFTAVGYVIMMLSGLLIVVLTIPSVWSGAAASSVLIVSMALMWRVLNPIQSIFANASRTEGLVAASKQVDALMRIAPERNSSSKVATSRTLNGKIRFSKVSFRYSANADPALLAVDFTINKGDVIGICGANGSGKTTLMRLILGMYRQQAGSVYVDGIDARQFDPYILRRSIGYAPQEIQMFRATIAQNLQLARPDADQAMMWRVLELAGASDQIAALPSQLEHRLGDSKKDLPESLMRKISLARAYITDAPIMMLDEPSTNLDDYGSDCFLEYLNHFRGEKTIIFSSHRPSHLRVSDRLMLFDRGYLHADAPPAEVLQKLIRI